MREIAPSDAPFTARMRFHQSWYRKFVLNLPAGPNPAAGNELYGNMLQPEDGQRGWNFLSQHTFASARSRAEENRGAVEPGRLFNNMLGSQPMCFNLFAPLKRNPFLSVALLAALPGSTTDRKMKRIEFEYAPDGNLLDDRTAFDVFIEYTTSGGRKGFLAIETKLTEPFSPKSYRPTDLRYAKWMAHGMSWWKPEIAADLSDVRYNQLWRDHLLAFSLLHRDGTEFDEGYCVVVHHDQDLGCALAIHDYRNHLNDDGAGTLVVWTLSDVLALLRSSATEREDLEWLNLFRLRYIALEASEGHWRLFKQSV